MPSNHEKYLAGVPLNPELEALKEGRAPEFGMGLASVIAQEPAARITDAERPLTAEERAALRELRQGVGWPVLQKLLERATLSHVRAATSLSEDDPLAKKDEIAQAWLMVKVWKQLRIQMNVMVEIELMEDRKAREEA
jgi:hypothetical protein